jgi:hypothetical protein
MDALVADGLMESVGRKPFTPDEYFRITSKGRAKLHYLKTSQLGAAQLYEDVETFLQCHVLGFCGCGLPEESLRYIRNFLRHTANLQLVHQNKLAHDEWDKAGDELMGNALWFTRYVLSSKKFTNHGGNVGRAWLTPKGAALLNDLDELFKTNDR